MSVSFLRHAGWVSPETLADQHLHIIGCGATGSHIALTAARMGFTSFTLWDADKVEAHNLPNQAYSDEHIGMLKVDALESVLLAFNKNITVEKHPYFFESEKHRDLLDETVVLTVDSMAARKDVYGVFKDNFEVQYVFETKLGFDYAELHLIDPSDNERCERWAAMLKDDSEVEPGPCNLRICATLVQIVASYAVHCMCARVAAINRDEEWVHRDRTHFLLDPTLSVIAR